MGMHHFALQQKRKAREPPLYTVKVIVGKRENLLINLNSPKIKVGDALLS